MMTKADIGTVIRIAQDNDEDTLDMVAFDSYTVVGIVQNPLYLNFERGTTSLGNGQLSGYAFLLEDGFDSEYYTEIYVTYAQDFALYSDAYEDFVDAHEDAVDAMTEERVDIHPLWTRQTSGSLMGKPSLRMQKRSFRTMKKSLRMQTGRCRTARKS